MTEADYIKRLDRIARSVAAKTGVEYIICGRQCRLYFATGGGNIVAYVWLGRLVGEGLKPVASFVAGPPISGSVAEVLRRLEEYRRAAEVVQQVVDRLGEDAVEWVEEEDIDTDEEVIDDDDADADE